MELGIFCAYLAAMGRNRGVFPMPQMIKMRDGRGKLVSGSFEVRDGMITVTASDGRNKTAILDMSLLNTETLARSLLLLLQNEKRQTASAAVATYQIRSADPALATLAAISIANAADDKPVKAPQPDVTATAAPADALPAADLLRRNTLRSPISLA
jgi:hypothetical protein